MEPHRDPFGPHVCGRYFGYGSDRCMLATGHPGLCPWRGAKALRERVKVRLLGGAPPADAVVEDGEWSATVTRAALQDLVEDTGATLLAVLLPPIPHAH